MLRKIIGVAIGIVLANLTVFGWEMLGHNLPLGAGALTAEEAVRPGAIDAIPLAAKLWVVAGWLIGAFAGALIAFRIARWDYAGWIVGALFAAICISVVVMIPHPLWMSLCAVALPFIGALFAFGASRRWRAADLHLRS